MRFAYADPPYLGCAARLYGDPLFDSLSAHKGMIDQMCADYPDGWAMSLNSTTLQSILPLCPSEFQASEDWRDYYIDKRSGLIWVTNGEAEEVEPK